MVNAVSMYAGCGVGQVTDVPTAARIVERMTAEAIQSPRPEADPGSEATTSSEDDRLG
jgi:hypothetical protein